MKRLKLPPNILIFIGSAALVIACLIIGLILYHNHAKTQADTHQAITTTTGYATILPKGKSITKLGGWERVSPPDSAPVYAFADMVSGVSISVSEQPLPASFKDDVDGNVATLAKGYDATTTINAHNTKVYIGTSAKGPQSLIFTKNNLLVLIKSQKQIDDAAWATYVESLQ